MLNGVDLSIAFAIIVENYSFASWVKMRLSSLAGICGLVRWRFLNVAFDW